MTETNNKKNGEKDYIDSLAELIRIPTVSSYGVFAEDVFDEFRKVLFRIFPNFFAIAQVKEFDGSLLIKWSGLKDSHPILLMSHHDVVEATGEWEKPPFGGIVSEGKMWGRGTLDTKGNLWAMLQAADELISEGFIPAQDIWFESSCNEEIDQKGANTITQFLAQKGMHFDLVLDEGGMILFDPVGVAPHLFAMVGVGEKDYIDIKFTARSHGGHSASPAQNTPLVRLGKFMAEVDKSRCFPAKISPAAMEMFRRMSPWMKAPLRFLFSNIRLFRGLLTMILPNLSPTANALLRSTAAFTQASGSVGRNVIPEEAYVVANMRVSHHQGTAAAIRAVSDIAGKYDIETEILDPGFESKISDHDNVGFKLVDNAIQKVFTDVTAVPFVTNAASDCKFFSRVSNCCLRFAPFIISDEQLDSIHGLNENVNISSLAPAVEFYRYIMTHTDTFL